MSHIWLHIPIAQKWLIIQSRPWIHNNENVGLNMGFHMDLFLKIIIFLKKDIVGKCKIYKIYLSISQKVKKSDTPPNLAIIFDTPSSPTPPLLKITKDEPLRVRVRIYTCVIYVGVATWCILQLLPKNNGVMTFLYRKTTGFWLFSQILMKLWPVYKKPRCKCHNLLRNFEYYCNFLRNSRDFFSIG